MSWDESSLHRWLARRLSDVPLAGGFGHDAAHLARALARPVVCVDGVVEGVHFERGARPNLIGAKACARALSDLAASAARPRAVLAALRAPRGTRERDLRAMLAAIDELASEHGARLVGGDLSSGEAGEILQKLRNYRLRLAVVCPPGIVALSRRFEEQMVEERRDPHFGLFESREQALAWLAAPGA